MLLCKDVVMWERGAGSCSGIVVVVRGDGGDENDSSVLFMCVGEWRERERETVQCEEKESDASSPSLSSKQPGQAAG